MQNWWVRFFNPLHSQREGDNTADQTLKVATQGNCISMRDLEMKTTLAWKTLIKPELNWIPDLERELKGRL